MSLKDPLMLAFFATIGLNANLASLRAGGKVLGTFLIVVVGLLLLQNALGIGMATLLGLDPLMGLPGRVDYLIRRPRHRGGVE
ncbi:Sodium/glutamate symport protein [Klebsiella pneumoniae]|uniref:Sodium/glutamate symport protein n=1 Tax=Klebsiella pneumoniae TaxID=573 RepID=A0A4P0YIP4_KLEPN|nr:Sodium/glutamate symport protein [Klebsiella pneumoniae]